jgi:uncharacterized Zn ribbon protein
MYSHSCIKCNTKYQDKDPDPYFCPACVAQKKALAEEIDKKVKARQSNKKEKMSLLQQYDSSPKVGGFMITKL